MLENSIFSFFHNVFYPLQKEFPCLSYIILWSANALNLDQSKILSFGKGLTTHYETFVAKSWYLARTARMPV